MKKLLLLIAVITLMSSFTPVFAKTDSEKVLAKLKKNQDFEYVFNGSIDKVRNLMANLSMNYPQYYVKYQKSYSWDDTTVKYSFKLSEDGIRTSRKLAKVMNPILRGAKKKKGIRAKVKYIDAKICKRCKYDYKTYKTGQLGTDSFTIYGCLVNKKAVCSGYTMAFQALATQSKIKSKVVEGKNHSWNKVKVGKKWYHVDVCWNDTSGTKDYLLKKKHKKC